MNIRKIICHPVTFGGSTKKGKSYSNFKEAIKSKLFGKINGPVIIKIKLFIEERRVGKNRNDLDNFLKPIIDAIDEKEIIENESSIESIVIERIKVPDKELEGVEIKIQNSISFDKTKTYIKQTFLKDKTKRRLKRWQDKEEKF